MAALVVDRRGRVRGDGLAGARQRRHCGQHAAARGEIESPCPRRSHRRRRTARRRAIRGDGDRHPAVAARGSVRPARRHQATRVVAARALLFGSQLCRLRRAADVRSGPGLPGGRAAGWPGVVDQRHVHVRAAEPARRRAVASARHRHDRRLHDAFPASTRRDPRAERGGRHSGPAVSDRAVCRGTDRSRDSLAHESGARHGRRSSPTRCSSGRRCRWH